MMPEQIQEHERPLPGADPSQRRRARRDCPVRILLVDDDLDCLRSVSIAVELMGHEVRAARDGRAALEAAAAPVPDLAFIDLGMPGMSGFELARQLRCSPELADLRLVALSGWGREQDFRRAREVGFDHFLVKPVDIWILEQIIAELMDSRVQ